MSISIHIIGLTGPAGCGKDTVANILRTHVGFYPLAFADALREQVCDAFGIEPLYLIRPETKGHAMSDLALRKCRSDEFIGRMAIWHLANGLPLAMDIPRSPRQILQWWGTEYRRHQAPEYWTQLLRHRIERLIMAGAVRRIVVTDCRFQNEVDTLRSDDLGGLLWQVQRPGCDVPSGAHVSEVTGAQFRPDAVIDNSGDIHHLQQQVLGKWWALEAGLQNVAMKITP